MAAINGVVKEENMGRERRNDRRFPAAGEVRGRGRAPRSWARGGVWRGAWRGQGACVERGQGASAWRRWKEEEERPGWATPGGEREEGMGAPGRSGLGLMGRLGF
jgi:outer membrane protein assembly factor BamB